MAMAAILDPYYRFQFAEWAYKKVWDDNYHVELNLLKDRLFAMFDEYVRESNIPSSSKSRTSTITLQATSEAKKGCHEFFEV